MKKIVEQLSLIYNGHRKKLIIMRNALLILLISTFQVLATGSYSQTTRLSLNMKGATIKQVLSSIEDQSDFYFLYNSELIDVTREININIENENIQNILNRVFNPNEVNILIKDKYIVLTPAANVSQQQKTISGKVTDPTGLPLPGVTIVLRGTTNGTITNTDGSFTLSNIPENSVIVFSFIGMKTQEIEVGSKNYFDIKMEQETIGVEEVVVTALGFKREEKALGYAVQKLGGETLSTVKGVDVGTSLTGKIAGLLVKNSTEFAADPEILIRGESPLLVIDGIPYGNMTLRDLPSDDIEDISVLKGATASALYGYRGESGAIMVTTKKGSANKGISVSVNSGTMFTAGYLAIPEMQSTYGRKITTSTNTYVTAGNGSWGPPLEGQDVIQWDPVSKSYQTMPYLPIGKDNFQNFLEQGYILNNNVSVIQQGEYGSVRSSATWVKNKGQYPNSNFDKLTYNLSGEMKLNKFTLTSSLSYNKQTSPNIGFNGYTSYDPMYNLLVWSSPDYDIRQYKDYWLVKNESQNNSYQSTNNNPYFDMYERIHSLDRDIFNGNIAISYEVLPWLKATFRTGYDTYSDRQVVRISMGSYISAGNAQVLKNGTYLWGESKKGSYNVGLGRGYSTNNDLLLTGEKEIGDFRIDGLAGGTIFYTQDEGIEAMTQGGLSIPGFYSLKSSVNAAKVNSNIYKRQVNSVFGRISVAWKDLIFAEGTLRNDWSSTLPESTRSYLYPSVSSSFVISELLPEMEWLSIWKLRGSWTSTKTPAGIYDINSVYSITNNVWGTLSEASYPTTIRGTDVRPESSSTFEFGSVINIFKNRASLDVSYYNKRMYDFLKSASISPASGYSANYVNTDEEITRKGLEITLKGTPIRTNDLRWDVAFNWTKYARFYTQLDDEFSADKPWVKVGERADHYVILDFQRDPNGNIIYSNGLPVYSSYYSLAGYADPDWIWGLSTSLNYKNFTFSVSADGRVGGLAQTVTEMYMWNSGNHPNSITPERYLDATEGGAHYIGDGVKVTSGTATYDTYGNITSDTREYATNDVAVTYENYIKRIHKGTAWGGVPSIYDLYSTTFFKIREVSLSYELPKKVYGFIGARGGSVSLIGQNVLLWAKDFKYSDPDGGSENFSDPSQRYMGFNIKLTF